MNNDGQKIVMCGICRPDGAWPLAGARATKMPLLRGLEPAKMTQGFHKSFNKLEEQ
jgi:hypothetical protein